MLKLLSLLLLPLLSVASGSDHESDTDPFSENRATRKNAPRHSKIKAPVIGKKLEQKNRNNSHFSRKDRKEGFKQIIEDDINFYQTNKAGRKNAPVKNENNNNVFNSFFEKKNNVTNSFTEKSIEELANKLIEKEVFVLDQENEFFKAYKLSQDTEKVFKEKAVISALFGTKRSDKKHQNLTNTAFDLL